MRQVDFYKLSRPVQDQFIASARGAGAPAPILKSKADARAQLTWLGVSAAAAFVLFAVYTLGHGALGSALAIHPLPFVAIYVVAAFVVALGILKAIAIRRALRVLPFPAGVYVFPASLVDARAAKLKVHAMAEATASGPVGSQPLFQITFAGGNKFSFPLAKAEQGAAVERALTTAKTQVDQAVATHDPRALAALDPLYDSAFSSPIGPTAPLKAHDPGWAKLPWAFAIAIAIVVGPAVFFARNARSDDRMFAKVSEQNDVAGYRAYLEQGQRHRDEVDGVLLPRAELREAEKAATVQAIEKYIAEHPKSKIDAEVQASLRASLLAELEQAKKVGTLGALKEFAKRHPAHGLDAELKQASHHVYVAALESYRARASDKDLAVVPFVERLLATAERTGPKVEIRFRRKASRSMARADTQISKSKMFMGMGSLPSRYFDPAHLLPREKALVQALAARFAEFFPTELVSLELGELIADLEAPLPPVTVPTLFVDHDVEWSGTLYPSKTPRGVFAGMIFTLEGSFRLPDASVKPLKTRLELWRPADLSIFKDDAEDAAPKPKTKGEDSSEARIYDAMSKDAFDAFAKRVSATFFKQPEKASKGGR